MGSGDSKYKNLAHSRQAPFCEGPWYPGARQERLAAAQRYALRRGSHDLRQLISMRARYLAAAARLLLLAVSSDVWAVLRVLRLGVSQPPSGAAAARLSDHPRAAENWPVPPSPLAPKADSLRSASSFNLPFPR